MLRPVPPLPIRPDPEPAYRVPWHFDRTLARPRFALVNVGDEVLHAISLHLLGSGTMLSRAPVTVPGKLCLITSQTVTTLPEMHTIDDWGRLRRRALLCLATRRRSPKIRHVLLDGPASRDCRFRRCWAPRDPPTSSAHIQATKHILWAPLKAKIVQRKSA